jgi:hypothetical protein
MTHESERFEENITPEKALRTVKEARQYMETVVATPGHKMQGLQLRIENIRNLSERLREAGKAASQLASAQKSETSRNEFLRYQVQATAYFIAASDCTRVLSDLEKKLEDFDVSSMQIYKDYIDMCERSIVFCENISESDWQDTTLEETRQARRILDTMNDSFTAIPGEFLNTLYADFIARFRVVYDTCQRFLVAKGGGTVEEERERDSKLAAGVPAEMLDKKK